MINDSGRRRISSSFVQPLSGHLYGTATFTVRIQNSLNGRKPTGLYHHLITTSRPAPISTPEPDYGSDDFEEATITFYDTSDCGNATDTEVYTMADLYELYEVADGTSCSASGDFDLYTVIQCSDGSPAAVYYEVHTARRSFLTFLCKISSCIRVPHSSCKW